MTLLFRDLIGQTRSRFGIFGTLRPLVAMAIFALAPFEQIVGEETAGPAPALQRATDPALLDPSAVPLRFTDQRHYPLHRSGGMAVSSADLEQYLKTLQERASARTFLLTFRDILFEPGSAELGEQERGDLAGMAEFLLAHPDTTARIIGHTDDRGEARSNTRLGEARAAAVQSFLISQGVAQSRLASVSSGEESPSGDNRTSDGQDSNRRVQILVQKPLAQAPRPDEPRR